MTTLAPHSERLSRSDTLNLAVQALSGKRAALIGFNAAAANELTQAITQAQAFARSFSLDIEPSSEILRPFELLLVDVELASGSAELVAGSVDLAARSVEPAEGSHWLKADELRTVLDRSIALGRPAVLLALLMRSRLPYHQFCIWPVTPDDLILRCFFALRSDSRAASRSSAANSTVVLADDDPSITSLVRLTLQRSGFSCEVASNGGEALELLNKWKPCATVLDIGMPNMDGFEVLSRVKNNPDLAQTRVILLTGNEQEMDILRGFSLGADDYVTKPFNPMELLMRLKRVVGRI